MSKLAGVLGLAVVATCAPRLAHAQASSQDKALAESLFRQAKALAKKEKYRKACPKFAESHRLDPQLGTLLHLATCHEQEGKTASAWAEYSAAAELAASKGDRRAKLATKRAEALEPGLSRLTMKRESGARPRAVNVTLDGKSIGQATLGTAVPVDPGEHQIEASADGYITWTETVDVGRDGEKVTVVIGDLDKAETPMDPERPSDPTEPSALPTVGWVTFGVGTAVFLTGLGLGGAAAAERDAADEACEGRFCSDEGLAMHDTARDLATASTVMFIVGLVGVGAGITIVLAAPSDEGVSALEVTPTLGGLTLGGAF